MDARAALALIALTLAPGQGSMVAPPPRPADAVDMKLYAGTYYEIARYPNAFQDQCAGDVTATYAVRPDGRLDVVDRCRTADGTTDAAVGVVRRARKDSSNGRLKVRFGPPWLSLIPRAWGDYWVLGTGPDYSYAVVGDPSREHLWILSRVPRMPPIAWQQAIEVATSNGYDASRLIRTKQEGNEGLNLEP